MKDKLKFLCDLPIYNTVQPYDLYGYPEQQSETQTNCQFEEKEVWVKDIRGTEGTTINTHGFSHITHASKCDLTASHFEQDEGNSEVLKYLSETVSLVREHLSAVDVICFDWRFRRWDPTVSGKIPPRGLQNIRNWALPTGDVMHCGDGSLSNDRLRMHLLPDEFERIRKNEYTVSIYNLWRPLNKTVKNTPLLFCDKRSVRKNDLIEVDKVLQDKVEKSYFLFYREYHKWYYLEDQRSDEVVLFQTWTSQSEGVEHADACPHGAGVYQTDGWKDPRESVEVRMIVLEERRSR